MITGNIFIHFQWFLELHLTEETLKRNVTLKKNNNKKNQHCSWEPLIEWLTRHNLLIVTLSHTLIQIAVKHDQWLEGSYLFEPSSASHANIQTDLS